MAGLIQYILHERAMTMTDLTRSILSEQEAAKFLNVSDPFLVTQFETGKLPYVETGAGRFVDVAELVTLKRSMHAEINFALEELAVQAQELHLGY